MSLRYRFGLIGYRISYSKSPAIFKSIFARAEIDGSFESYDFPPEQLEQEFLRLKKSGISGLSVTIPYKVTVMDYLTTVDKAAGIVGAVNSIKLKDGKAYGYNTDACGFSLGLESHRDQVSGRSATILGCGGAAAAAVYSLYSDYEIRAFQVYGRNDKKLNAFIHRLKKELANSKFEALLLNSTDPTPNPTAMIVNCTPLGGGSLPRENPLPQALDWKETQVYYDLNYNIDNPAIAEARKKGVAAIDGRKMLVGQAVRSFKIWTGRDVDYEPVYEDVFGRE